MNIRVFSPSQTRTYLVFKMTNIVMVFIEDIQALYSMDAVIPLQSTLFLNRFLL